MQYILVFLLTPLLSICQTRPHIGFGAGHLNNVAIEMKAGVTINRVVIEANVAFSAVVPFQHGLKAGYRFGNQLYGIPYAGVTYDAYAQHDREKNTLKLAYGGEFGYRMNLTNTYGAEVLSAADIHAVFFGRYIGMGMRFTF